MRMVRVLRHHVGKAGGDSGGLAGRPVQSVGRQHPLGHHQHPPVLVAVQPLEAPGCMVTELTTVWPSARIMTDAGPPTVPRAISVRVIGAAAAAAESPPRHAPPTVTARAVATNMPTATEPIRPRRCMVPPWSEDPEHPESSDPCRTGQFAASTRSRPVDAERLPVDPALRVRPGNAPAYRPVGSRGTAQCGSVIMPAPTVTFGDSSI